MAHTPKRIRIGLLFIAAAWMASAASPAPAASAAAPLDTAEAALPAATPSPATGPATAGKPFGLNGKYLDCHVHTAGIGEKGSGCFISKQLRESYKFPIYLKAFGVSERELMDEGDGLVPDRISAKLAESKTVGGAVLLAMDGVADSAGGLDTIRTQLYIPNAFVAGEARRHANLYFGASVNPGRKGAVEELRRVKAEGAVLVKWIPSIMDIDPADSANIPFYLALKELGLPLLTHTGTENSFLAAKDSLCDPFRLELPLSLGVTVIAAHVGTPGKSHKQENMERALIMMARHPNLYADISSLTQVNKLGYLKRILPRKEVKGRLLYGTDFPLIETALVSPYYYTWRAPFTRLRAAARETNPWDRDVALKKALGVGEDIFARSGALLLPQGK
ncbi:MAG: amidohydrolase 2 [Fibrobacteres bacterium]|nr:amidohydrolase 2 [Fibrobacterota bacterium]